jgi:hypothetical protein
MAWQSDLLRDPGGDPHGALISDLYVPTMVPTLLRPGTVLPKISDFCQQLHGSLLMLRYEINSIVLAFR